MNSNKRKAYYNRDFLSYFEHVRKVLDWYIFSPEMLTILPPGNGLDSFIQE